MARAGFYTSRKDIPEFNFWGGCGSPRKRVKLNEELEREAEEEMENDLENNRIDLMENDDFEKKSS